MSKIGFIGLGVMGFPMAGHLSKVNSVAVFNRTKKKLLPGNGLTTASYAKVQNILRDMFTSLLVYR